jgi:hypothetical protein
MSSDENKRRHALPRPDTLVGSDDLESWLLTMRAKLQVDGGAIGDDFAQFFYVFNCINSQARQLLLPYATAASSKAIDNAAIVELVRRIEQLYGDPQRARKAGLRLVNLRQGEVEPCATYIPRWEQCLFEAKASTWPDDAKILLLVNGLASAVRSRLELDTWPVAFDKFTALLRQYDGTSVLAAYSQRPRRSTVGPSDAMEVDVLSVNVSTTERARRYRQGLCLQCGNPGHRARVCPSRDAPTALKTRVGSVRFDTATITEDGDDDGLDE